MKPINDLEKLDFQVYKYLLSTFSLPKMNRQDGLKTRRLLMWACINLAYKSGYKAITGLEITLEAKVNKTAIQMCFDSVENLKTLCKTIYPLPEFRSVMDENVALRMEVEELKKKLSEKNAP